MEDHTLQLVLVKPNGFLPKEPTEATHIFYNLFTKLVVEVIHYNNMLNEEPIETNYYSNLFVEDLVYVNIKGLIADNLIERITYHDLSNLELGGTGLNDLLKMQSIGNLPVIPNSTQSNGVL